MEETLEAEQQRPRDRGRRRGGHTRETIVARALELTSEGGLQSLSIGSLAAAVGLSKSGLFAHFGSMEDLQVAVMRAAARRFTAEVLAPALGAPRGEARLGALLERWIGWAHAEGLPGGCPFIAVASDLDDRPGPVRDILVQVQRDWLDALAGAARGAVQEGQLRGDLDVEQLAYEVYGVLLAYHRFDRLLGDPRAEQRCRDAFEALLARHRA